MGLRKQYYSMILVILILWIQSSCQVDGTDSYGFTKDDYVIYNTVIEYAEQKVRDYVVVGMKKNIDWRKYHINSLNRVPMQYEEPLNAFLEIDTVMQDWDGLASLGYEVIDADTFKTIIEDKINNKISYWRDSIRLMKIGYDKKKEKALVFFSWTCGNLCGEGRFVFLVRKSGKWEISDTMMLWIS